MTIKKIFCLLFSIVAVFSMQACETNAMCCDDAGEAEKESPTKNPVIQYLGQASLRIVTEQGKVIYIDPYSGDDYSLAADLILVTHEHFDHNGVDKVKNRNDKCRIIRSSDAVSDGTHKNFPLGYVTIEAVEAGNNRYHDIKDCVGYVLTFENGKKVYISGDTSTTEQMREMDKMNIDYTFLCTDGVYNMGLDEAAKAADLIKARFVIPYHNCTTGKDGNFSLEAAEAFRVDNKIILKPGEKLEIK